MGLFAAMKFVFSEVSFRVRHGAPYVRSLKTIGVNLYRRTPHVSPPKGRPFLPTYTRLPVLRTPSPGT